jgi:hypothetical protein
MQVDLSQKRSKTEFHIPGEKDPEGQKQQSSGNRKEHHKKTVHAPVLKGNIKQQHPLFHNQPVKKLNSTPEQKIAHPGQDPDKQSQGDHEGVFAYGKTGQKCKGALAHVAEHGDTT